MSADNESGHRITLPSVLMKDGITIEAIGFKSEYLDEGFFAGPVYYLTSDGKTTPVYEALDADGRWYPEWITRDRATQIADRLDLPLRDL